MREALEAVLRLPNRERHITCDGSAFIQEVYTFMIDENPEVFFFVYQRIFYGELKVRSMLCYKNAFVPKYVNRHVVMMSRSNRSAVAMWKDTFLDGVASLGGCIVLIRGMIPSGSVGLSHSESN